uniref:Selenide, water dikinase n=1 Tax=Onchocerca volvulus TaxID=6282 RepID=A0A8R1TU82_ONCVO
MKSIINRIKSGFNPVDHGLPADFLLTRLTQMKGCGCKVPRAVLLELLKDLKTNDNGDERDYSLPTLHLIIYKLFTGIGLDCCVIPLRHQGLSLVQTTDFFYPLVDDPYLMGRITCANVLSDLYAMGVVNCDNMLILLGVPKDISDKERDVVTTNFFDGFKDTAVEAGTAIRGGQTVRCPWLLLGGVATSVCSVNEMAVVDEARPGDVLLLTKPLGGQLAVNSYEWLKMGNSRVKELNLNEARIVTAYQQVLEQMCRLNRNAARMTLKYGTHASTDVTGFGILGHADNLAKAQKAEVQFVIHTLPIIDYMAEISKAMGNGFNLFSGTSAETSGGLLIAVEKEKAEHLRTELEQLDGFPVWLVGDVVSGLRGAVIAKDVKIVSVASRIHLM